MKDHNRKDRKNDSVTRNIEDIEQLERLEVIAEFSELELQRQTVVLLAKILKELKAEHQTVRSFNIVQR